MDEAERKVNVNIAHRLLRAFTDSVTVNDGKIRDGFARAFHCQPSESGTIYLNLAKCDLIAQKIDKQLRDSHPKLEPLYKEVIPAIQSIVRVNDLNEPWSNVSGRITSLLPSLHTFAIFLDEVQTGTITKG